MKTTLLSVLAFIFVFASSISAQFSTPEALIETNKLWGPGFAADLDQDGDMEVIQSNALINNRFRIYLLVQGEYISQDFYVDLGSGSSESNILKGAADLDSDGDLDPYNGFGWIENDNFNFSTLNHFFPQHNSGINATSADLNNDGYSDVIISNVSNAQNTGLWNFAILINNGLGEFTSSFPFVENPGEVNLTDFNNDGNLDLYRYQSYSYQIFAYTGNGDGTFSNPFVLFNDVKGPFGFANLNADNYIDFFITNNPSGPGNDNLKIYEGSSIGAFTDFQSFAMPFRSAYWYDANTNLTTDYDNDGDIDLMFKPSRDIYWIENLGNSWQSRGLVLTRVSSANSFIWQDLNGDNLKDGLETGEVMSIYYQDSTNKLEPNKFACHGGCYGKKFFQLSDLNNDGKTDLFTSTSAGLTINELSSYNYVETHLACAPFEETKPLTLFDFNRDGMKDIVSWRYDIGLFYLERIDEFKFKPIAPILPNFTPGNGCISIGYDVNQDGSEDLVVLQSDFTNAIYWFSFQENNGWVNQGLIGQFGPSGSGNENPNALQVSDFNGDGVLDLIVVTSRSCYAAIQQGGGNFTLQLLYQTNSENIRLIVFENPMADFNGDGRADILFQVKNIASSTALIHWIYGYYNGSNYSFTTAHTFEPSETWGSNPVGTNADFDLDGYTDIVYSFDGELRFLKNNGSSFNTPVTLPFVAPFIISDLKAIYNNNDVMPDLIFSYSDNNDHILTANNLFASPYQIHVDAFVDYNGNGVFDNNDIPLQNEQITLSDNGGSFFTNAQGEYTIYTLAGEWTAGITLNTDLWTAITPTVQTVTLSDTQPTANVTFAIQPIGSIYHVEAQTQTMADICGMDNGHWISIQNTGNTSTDIRVSYTLDELFTYQWSSIEPSSVVGQTITWILEDVPFDQSMTFTVVATAPDVNATGTQVSHTLIVETLDEIGSIINSMEVANNYTIECSAQSNDLYESEGWTENGYINQDGSVLYTVRFQNQGSLPAENVRIETQLSANLDFSTLTPEAASHPYSIDLSSTGELNIIFDQIQLVPANTNPITSNGFVTFRVHPISNLAPGTEIYNSASVYFDLNAPSVTNMVRNEIFNCETLSIEVPEILCANEPFSAFCAREDFLNYTWYINDQAVSQGQESQLLNLESGLQILQLEASNPICTISRSEPIVVTAQPNLSLSSNNELVCDWPFIISATSNTDVTWYQGEEVIGMGTEQTFSAPGNYTAISNNLCGTVTQSILLTSGEYPSLTTPMTDISQCGSQAEITAVTEEAVTFTWYYNGEFISNETTIIASNSGSYSLILDNGCLTTEYPFTVTLHPIPVIEYVIDYNELIIEVDPGYVSYVWYSYGELIEGANESNMAINADNYVVVVTDEFGCTNSEEIWIEAVKEAKSENALVYPVPAQDVLNIQAKHLKAGTYITITNALGQWIESIQVSSNNKLTLSISHLDAGVYFINYQNDVWKFIKQ